MNSMHKGSNKLIFTGNLQLKKLQKLKPEKKTYDLFHIHVLFVSVHKAATVTIQTYINKMKA